MTCRLIALLLLAPFILNAQQKEKSKQYPSLFWEITGNGLKKPSYLFGTMHVSNKLAFQLSDSFYLGIKNADVVALETNPESWQEDMTKYGNGNDMYSRYGGMYTPMPEDYLTENTLKFYKYDKKIERSLYSNPSSINNLLYRNHDRGNSDFEEDTYLDMYIYQCGKRWGKKVAGVERYGESMKLMAEAYRDAAKDVNKKVRSYDSDNAYTLDKLQEAYRTGNLDLLDSINKFNSFSEAFDEKFLYKRNEIQAESIDSILKSKSSLFVGVGAAHLPGSRGVIEMLRAMGYKLRPIKMGQRDSQHKNSVEKIRVPVVFHTQAPEDSLFTVDIPGKFYKFGEDGALDQRQYADMANGSYYMVTRLMTNAWMWGHTPDDVFRTVDSLLYENIPGKILSKTIITKDGFKGFAITNLTRRGDIQRYNIFVTPFEVIFFKMSGTGEYVKNGDEADRFFNSIKFRPYKTGETNTGKYSPPYGGFNIAFPHAPYIGNDGSWIFDAEDKAANIQYRVVRSDIHNYSFAGEDTFELRLMEESFAASEFIGKKISAKQIKYKGFPALECVYNDTYGKVYNVRFIIKGPHYYTLFARGKTVNDNMRKFLDSFEFTPFEYGAAKERVDTSLYFTVKSPVYPEAREDFDIPGSQSVRDVDEEQEPEMEQIRSGIFRSKMIANDTTGERIFVSFFSVRRYFHAPDSNWLDKYLEPGAIVDSTRLTRSLKKSSLPDGTLMWDRVISDSGSSRAQWIRTYYKDGVGFKLVTETDTLSEPSAFVRSFYQTFRPADTIKGSNPFVAKANDFFNDFLSTDSVRHKRAVKSLYEFSPDSTNLELAKKAVTSLNWGEKRYLDVKSSLISRLANIKTRETSDYLKDLYYAAGDTVELQYICLETLLRQKTHYAFQVFKDVVTNEPPVLGMGSENNYGRRSVNAYSSYYSNGAFMDELFDSLQLTKTILPDIMPLLNLDDYEQGLMQLLGQMVDSNLVKPDDYRMYFSKFLIEAKQEMKKQRISDKNRQIKKAELEKEKEDNPYGFNEDDPGNDDLDLYARLILPFEKENPAVEPLMRQMLASTDKKLKYATMMLLMRNGKPVPDSIVNKFAADEDFSYLFYSDLMKRGDENKFPKAFRNQQAMAKSQLLSSWVYDKPDSIVFLQRLSATTKHHKGFVYFFKYKRKKDDVGWKIATSGLMPADTLKMLFDAPKRTQLFNRGPERASDFNVDFTGFSQEKLNEDQPYTEQLSKLLKKMVYSKHKSASIFYGSSNNNRNDYSETYEF